MGQQTSTYQPPSSRNYQYKPNLFKIQHQGILKLRSTPFQNCVQIQANNETLFLQDAQMGLGDLLNNRYYTNRLFLIDDIQKIIQGITYTLAYLEQNNIVYKDLNTQNIYYSGSSFKVLPNQLIQFSTYERAQSYLLANQRRNIQNQEQINFPFLSPQLIIALRYKETRIDDLQVLQKSNVFILGMILLQATTLMPSRQCYDQYNYDIFNTVISQRLQIVEDHYNQKIARIVGNMLDYDYSERMNPKKLSIWVNRELSGEKQQIRSVFSSQKSKIMKSNISKSSLKKSIAKSHISQKQFQNPKTKTHSRTNLVYINGGNINNENDNENKQMIYYQRGQKNKVYLDQRFQAKDPFMQQHKIKLQNLTAQNYFNQNHQKNIRDRQKQVNKQNIKQIQQQRQLRERQQFQRQKQKQRQIYKKNQRQVPIRKQYRIQRFDRKTYLDNNQPQQFYRPKQQKNQIQHKNNLNKAYQDSLDDIAFPTNHRGQVYQKRQTQNIHQQRKIPQKSKLQNNPYYQPPQRKEQPQPLKTKSMNKYFPDLQEFEKGKITQTKRVVKHTQVNSKQIFHKDSFDQKDYQSKPDESINRIKVEIEKSRKLIQQFRRSEGLSKN